MSIQVADRLFSKGPKRMLALDGGGTRGIVTIAFLREIEAVLSERSVRLGHVARASDFRLSQYFDLVGGTSVGALVATLVAMGWRVEQIDTTFKKLCRTAFRRPWQRPWTWFGPYSAALLEKAVHDIAGDAPLSSDQLKTGLLVVTKRADTNSVWPLINNPRSIYWQGKDGQIDNGAYKIADVLRASSAAPTYYAPKSITIERFLEGGKENSRPGLFVDGGVSPHNNPAMQMLLAASVPGYNLGGADPKLVRGNCRHGATWDLGPDKLLLISVGTGTVLTEVNSWVPHIAAVQSLLSIIGDAEQLVLAQLQALSAPPMAASGEPRPRWIVDSEVGTLEGAQLSSSPRLTFQRYDIRLEGAWLQLPGAREREYGINAKDLVRSAVATNRVTMDKLSGLQKIINPAVVPILDDVAVAAAKEQVSADDFPAVFDRAPALPRLTLFPGLV